MSELSSSSKRCTRCREIKPLDDFHRDKGKKDGRSSYCKECAVENAQIYYRENREKCRKRQREYYKENSEEIRRRSAGYYEAHKGSEEFRLQRSESGRRYREANKDKVKARHKHYHEENYERVLESQRQYRARNSAKLSEKNKQYRAENAGRAREWNRRRRARKAGAGGNFTEQEFYEICARYDFHCLRCGQECDSLTSDHIVPLSKGGSDNISNIQPLCKSCNSAKGVKTVDFRYPEIDCAASKATCLSARDY